MATIADLPTMPAAPADDNQRQYLYDLITDAAALERAYIEIRDAAAHRADKLAGGAIPVLPFQGSGPFIGGGAVALHLETAIVTRAEARRVYGASAEQVYYALRVGALEDFNERDQVSHDWLHGTASTVEDADKQA